jgi:hypothetical protein
MVEEILIQYIKEFGFPVFVVLWFMFRTEKILKANNTAIEKLTLALSTLQ